MGDVYILGSGLDYTEFDLWWLFSRRAREKAQVGKYVYYEPEEVSEEKKQILELLGIEWKSLDFIKHKKIKYSQFYDEVIEDLSKLFDKNINKLKN